jgi:hypothetical protein
MENISSNNSTLKRQCNYCGTILEVSSSFCPSCGATLTTEVAPAPQIKSAEPTNDNWMLALVNIALFCFVFPLFLVVFANPILGLILSLVPLGAFVFFVAKNKLKALNIAGMILVAIIAIIGIIYETNFDFHLASFLGY